MLQPMGSQRVGHDWVTEPQQNILRLVFRKIHSKLYQQLKCLKSSMTILFNLLKSATSESKNKNPNGFLIKTAMTLIHRWHF